MSSFINLLFVSSSPLNGFHPLSKTEPFLTQQIPIWRCSAHCCATQVLQRGRFIRNVQNRWMSRKFRGYLCWFHVGVATLS